MRFWIFYRKGAIQIINVIIVMLICHLVFDQHIKRRNYNDYWFATFSWSVRFYEVSKWWQNSQYIFFYEIQWAWEWKVVFLLTWYFVYQLLSKRSWLPLRFMRTPCLVLRPHVQFNWKSSIFRLLIGSFRGCCFPTAGQG